MKIDKELMQAFREGEAAGASGARYRDNPYYYTSAMSRAWDLGRWLFTGERGREVAKVLGLSSRGLTFENTDGRTRRFCTGEIRCTGAYEHWTVAV